MQISRAAVAIEELVVGLATVANVFGLLDATFGVDSQPPQRAEEIFCPDGYGEGFAAVARDPAEVVQQADVGGEFVAQALGATNSPRSIIRPGSQIPSKP